MRVNAGFNQIILANYTQSELRRLHAIAELMRYVRGRSVATGHGPNNH